jgi:hypothetical protein
VSLSIGFSYLGQALSAITAVGTVAAKYQKHKIVVYRLIADVPVTHQEQPL